MKENIDQEELMGLLNEQRLLKKRFRYSIISFALIFSIILIIFIAARESNMRINSVEDKLTKKDSANSALIHKIEKLKAKPLYLPITYAIPTGKVSHPGKYADDSKLPQFEYFICLEIDDSVKGKITKVDYYLNHPTFQQKLYSSTNPNDSFKVSYKGWGCLETIEIFIHSESKIDTLLFAMCDNLQLRGFSMAVK